MKLSKTIYSIHCFSFKTTNLDLLTQSNRYQVYKNTREQRNYVSLYEKE